MKEWHLQSYSQFTFRSVKISEFFPTLFHFQRAHLLRIEHFCNTFSLLYVDETIDIRAKHIQYQPNFDLNQIFWPSNRNSLRMILPTLNVLRYSFSHWLLVGVCSQIVNGWISVRLRIGMFAFELISTNNSDWNYFGAIYVWLSETTQSLIPTDKFFVQIPGETEKSTTNQIFVHPKCKPANSWWSKQFLSRKLYDEICPSNQMKVSIRKLIWKWTLAIQIIFIQKWRWKWRTLDNRKIRVMMFR